jgi:hypothetical protein
MNTKSQIFIKLIDEGIEVYRPVDAELIEENIYRILKTNHNCKNSALEEWEFLPNDIVECKTKKMKGDFNKLNDIIVAILKQP